MSPVSLAGTLLAATVLVPLALAAACLSSRIRARAPSLLAVAPIPALLAAVLAPGGTVAFFPPPFRLSLALDGAGATLLGGSALLWIMAGAYASSTMRESGRIREFAIWWLVTLAGSLGVFVVADIASFYLMFTIASLAAYGLIVHDETPRARRAAAVYVGLAVVGEACLLLAFVTLANLDPAANPLIREAVAALPSSPAFGRIVALLLVGFALKMGLVPLHVWLPLAHPVAPAPASAVLSGALVGAGVIGLIRFLPFDSGAPTSGSALAAAGIVTAYYGVVVGFTQTRPKVVLAYSTVSQMGLVAAIAGTGLAIADGGAPLLAAYYTLHHALVKGGLFLAVGIVAAAGAAQRRSILIVTALLALSLCGLPFTSGALAKLAAKPMLGGGLVESAFTLAAAGSTLLMLHFIAIVAREPAPAGDAHVRAGSVAPWLALAVLSLVVPWALYPGISGKGAASAFEPSAIWTLAWPIAAGCVATLALARFWRHRPTLPEGDVIVLANACDPLLRRIGRGFEKAEWALTQWPVGSALLVGVAVALGVAMLFAPGG